MGNILTKATISVALAMLLFAFPPGKANAAPLADQQLHHVYDTVLFPRPLRQSHSRRDNVPVPEVVRWNALLLDAIRVNRTFPPTATRNLAMAHAAMFDAVNSINPRYEPYLGLLPDAEDASSPAAIVAAAHGVAKAVFPLQATDWDAALAASLALLSEDDAKARGIAVGQAAAAAILTNRANDGSTNTVQYQPKLLPGKWRPTRPDYLPALSPHWGNLRPFAIASAADFMAPPPPALTSTQYAEDYNEVKSLGEVFLSTRTPEETQIAYFWADPAGSVSPPGHWNLIAADMIVNHSMDELSATHTLALLNLTLADAAIVCWRNKYVDEFWRPITAINLGDTDGNDDTVLDQYWTPLLLSPRFPEYTSGHSTFSGAAALVLSHLFGDETPFTASSDELLFNYGMPDLTRGFANFEAAAKEASRSRILGGIHFRFACEKGLNSGQEVGDSVVQTILLTRSTDVWSIH